MLLTTVARHIPTTQGQLEKVAWGKASDCLPEEVERLGAKKAFIVASRTLAENTGEIAAAEQVCIVRVSRVRSYRGT